MRELPILFGEKPSRMDDGRNVPCNEDLSGRAGYAWKLSFNLLFQTEIHVSPNW